MIGRRGGCTGAIIPILLLIAIFCILALIIPEPGFGF